MKIENEIKLEIFKIIRSDLPDDEKSEKLYNFFYFNKEKLDKIEHVKNALSNLGLKE